MELARSPMDFFESQHQLEARRNHAAGWHDTVDEMANTLLHALVCLYSTLVVAQYQTNCFRVCATIDVLLT